MRFYGQLLLQYLSEAIVVNGLPLLWPLLLLPGLVQFVNNASCSAKARKPCVMRTFAPPVRACHYLDDRGYLHCEPMGVASYAAFGWGVHFYY